MTFAHYAREIGREFRGGGGRLSFFVVCLAVGVAAVVAVAGLSAGVEEVLRAEARPLLAADVGVHGHRPLPAAVARALDRVAGVRRAEVRELATMASAPESSGPPGPSQLVEVKAAGAGYPFYGTLTLDPSLPLERLLDGSSAVVAPEVLARLGLRVGDRVRLGRAAFRVVGTVASEPDRVTFSFHLGPRVFLSLEGLSRAGLEGFGSRATYRMLAALPPGSDEARAEAVAAELRRVLPPGAHFDVETFRDAQPNLRRALGRGTRFLGLVALLSLLVGGIGVAQTVRAWLAERLDGLAIQRCLGLRPREVTALYLGQIGVLALAGCAAGGVLGTGVLFAVSRLAGDLLPARSLPLWQPWALARGAGLGLGLSLLFCLPTLLTVRRVSPLRALRRDAEPLPANRWAAGAAGGALAAGIFATATVQSRSPVLGAQFTGGLLAVAALLAAAALLAIRVAARLPRGWARGRPWLRYGLGAPARPGADGVGSIVGLGLGVLLVLATWLVQEGLRGQLGAEMPKDAPSSFLLDIQPDQWPGVERLVRAQGATRVESVPLVMARLRAVDGRPVEALAGREDDERGRRRWTLTREQRLTYLRELPPGNVVVAGRLWSDPSRAEVSVEKEFAADLGARLGSVLTFDVQGVPFDFVVTTLRAVEWKTFGINFFLVAEPGFLEKAPQARVAAVRFPPGGDPRAQDVLAARFPNVTVLRVGDLLAKVAAVLDRVALGVQLLGGFTVAAGVAILVGAVAAASGRRGREVALLKTLGMTRRGVVGALALEYALVGAVAGLVGSFGAGVASWAVLTRGMEVPWHFRPAAHLTALAGATLLAAAAGVGASAGALRKRPVEVLRHE